MPILIWKLAALPIAGLPLLMSWLIFAFLFVLCFFGKANAQTDITDNLTVQITIQAECTIVTTSAVDFGTSGVLDSAIDMAGSISVQCTDGEDYDIGLGAGNGAGASITDRKMTGPGSATIDYSLFRDSGRTQNWGDIASGDIVSGTGDGADQVISVYGRVPAQTTPAAGSYSDTVLVTVSY